MRSVIGVSVGMLGWGAAGSSASRERDSLFENFVDEIDAWARHAMAANGFGDY